MQGIDLDERDVKMWAPEEVSDLSYDSRPYRKGMTASAHVADLEAQAAAASRFHNDGKTPAQRRKEHYATLSRTARFVWLCWMPVVCLSGHINLQAQWMVIHAQKVADFIAAHATDPVSPWRLRNRRRECRGCQHRAGAWCGASTCNCGQWRLSKLKHVTRLSAVGCPKDKWRIGWTRQAYNWARNLLARRKDL